MTTTPTKTALLFVGQGAQSVGMTRDLLAVPDVAAMYNTARAVLGYDLAAIAVNGPAERLDATEVAQPALLVADLAALTKLRAEQPAAGRPGTCVGMAGLSLGEYAALVAADAMSFADALAVVKVRAEAMQRAADARRGVMTTVIGVDAPALEAACARAAESTGAVVQVCNYLFPKGMAVGGEPAGVEAVKAAVSGGRGVMVKDLQVAGAFHTSMMASACAPLAAALADVPLRMPSVPVYSNVTGRPYASVEELRAGLVQQVVAPVRWQESVEHLLQQNADDASALVCYDLGPRDTLKAMLRKTNAAAWKTCVSVDVM